MIKYIIVIIVISAVFTSSFAIAKQRLTSQQIAAKSIPSIVTIRTYDSSNNEISLGTGFAINSYGTILTNNHVIKDGYSIIVTDNKGKKYNNVLVLGADEERDVALLKVFDCNLPMLLISDGSEVRQGDKVYAIGNPMGFERTFSDGMVSSIRTLDHIKVIQFTAPISPGSSGGPLLNIAGKVIGINTMTHTKGQNINIAISSQEFIKLIKKTNKTHNNQSNEYFTRSNKKSQNVKIDIDATVSDKSIWDNINWSDIENSKFFNQIQPNTNSITLFDINASVAINRNAGYENFIITLDPSFNDNDRALNWANSNFGKSIKKIKTLKYGPIVSVDGYDYVYLANNTVIYIEITNGIKIKFQKRNTNEAIYPNLYLLCSYKVDAGKSYEKNIEQDFLLDPNSNYVRKHDYQYRTATAKYTPTTIDITETISIGPLFDSNDYKTRYVIDRTTGKLKVYYNNEHNSSTTGSCTDNSKLKAIF